MSNTEITVCPCCGSYRLQGEIRTNKPDLSLGGRLREAKSCIDDVFSLGFIGAEIKAVKKSISRFRVDKLWICCDCGCTFPMK